MNRRGFIGGVAGGLIVVSLDVKAQQVGPMRRIGWLWNEPPDTADIERKAYPAHLRAVGWIVGQNLIVENRYTSGRTELLKALAEELVRLRVDLIVAEGTIVTLAAKKVTSTIPIVVARSADPVRTGLVASVARPGGNVTGTSTLVSVLYHKRAQLLHELLPDVRRIGDLVTANPIDRINRIEYERMYRSLGMQAIFVEVTQVNELEPAIDEMARQGAQVLLAGAEPFLGTNYPLILQAARKHSLPVIVEEREPLEGGALISYAPNEVELDRQLIFIIDKILRGAKPADLPILQPSKFELLINLKTAKSLGIAIPKSLLLRADEVIQ